MKKIIVPVDFSLHSENALRTAASFAKQFKSEIVAVHMLELSNALISVSSSYINEQAVFQIKLARQKFDEFLDKPYLSDITVSTLIQPYKDFSSFHDLKGQEDADLIIMSSQGATGFKEMFLGSNSEVVVRNSTIPVLVIKGLPITEPFKKVVFACDFSNDFVEPYKQAKEILSVFKCEIELVHVNTPGAKFKTTKEKKERIDSFLYNVGESFENKPKIVEVSDYKIEDGILEYAQTNQSDLIIMPTHGKHGIEHFLDGSIAEDIVNHAALPVLTIKI
ncbi:universal stress protein [Tenacibaculum jejuense]|uniref:UspA n=1 Tax=Tenacibaculum jejuense TaxID=584609 RepID=A0A238U7Y5_9FLAO|nr:universal stress protein [Tenacibaculum jejuense]SNR14510.1 UspA [Tenacibaculum jejuense]